MIPKPSSAAELAKILAEAFARKEKVGPVNLGTLNRVVEYAPEDMTVTVEAGITLSALQAALARHKQWLPIDPPNPERLTIGDIVNANASGPRRFGWGTIRDHLIGIEVALADGSVIHSGGKVVKNVAGYDLGKLFIGAHGSLGVVMKATFKLRPLPEMERFVQARCESLEAADKLIEAVSESEITPVVLDMHNLPMSTPQASGSLLTSENVPMGVKDGAKNESEPPYVGCYPDGFCIVILGFAGTQEEVEWQSAKAGELGFAEPSSLDYETRFWEAGDSVQRLPVLPSKIVPAIGGLNGAPFLARAGNGIIYHRGEPAARQGEMPLELMRRLKEAFDPRHILPDFPL